jgi:iron complex transport system substrate-binding protein
MARILNLLLFTLLLLSCSQKHETACTTTPPDSSVVINYAKGFRIDYFPRYKKISVLNPWKKNELSACYYLVQHKNTATPPDGQKIVVPLHRIAATSCTHFEFLHLLGELSGVKGICSPQLIYNNYLQTKFRAGELTDLGDAFNLNIEKIQLMQPNAVMISGFNHEDPVAKRLQENGIPVIYNNEWMENSLLARAEWIKFVAAFYNKQTLADSLFEGISSRYNKVKQRAKESTKKPSIVCGGNFKGTWYLPGGKNYMAQLFADAQGNYFYANDSSTASLPFNFEAVFTNFHQADVWVACSAASLQELINSDPRHALFKAVKNKQVYNFNKRYTATGANDFWESGIAHPDLILSDMIKLLHPELLPEYEFTYTKKLD